MPLPRPARPLVALLALLAPGLLVLGTATPSYAGTLCGTPLALGDCTAPVAEIYRAMTAPRGLDIEPGGETTARTADIWARPKDLKDPDVQKITYTCQLEKDGGVVKAWEDCTKEPDPGTQSASLAHAALDTLSPGSYTLSIRAKDAAKDVLGNDAPNEQAAPTTFTWKVVEPVEDHAPPETRISRGLKRWHLFPYAQVEYVGNEPLQDARCRLQGRARDCDASQATMMGLSSGDWTFDVAGVDYAGNVDRTPAVNRFTVPVPSSKLKASSGWKRGTEFGYFFNGYSTTKKKGATLSAARAGTRSVALVATKCRGCGSVKVTYGGKVLARVSLAAPSTKRRQLVPIARWSTAHGGKVSVTVTSSGKPVTVEGLGFSRRR